LKKLKFKRQLKQGVDGNKEVLHNLVSLLLTNTTLRSKKQKPSGEFK